MQSETEVGVRSGRVVLPGKPEPLGATPTIHGTQFAFFSRDATAATLLLFDHADDDEPSEEIPFDPRINRTGDIWHLTLPGVDAGQLYLLRVEGVYDPAAGLRFNPHKALLDPCAKALTGSSIWRHPENFGYDRAQLTIPVSTAGSASAAGDSSRSDVRPEPPASRSFNCATMPKCIVVDNDAFDWQGDRPLNYPLRFSVIYETHVRGLTAHPSSGVAHPGTYRGVIEMIPYLTDLGITSLELLPVQEFDELENSKRNPATGERLTNYWGYSTIAFFAPKGSYSSTGPNGGQVNEFKEMVRELHRAGIEVIIDIVFNHTGEGNQFGPTFSFRGLDNRIYYLLDTDRRGYLNFSGCGNTFNCNHPVVRTFIIDCLHYWVTEMHVDGFRFDLGSILGRDQNGKLMEDPPILLRIAEDPVLRNTKIIAEAWDAAGAYQVGSFPGGRWAEWNDRYRDDVRRFWRGDPSTTGHLATRITGSSDLYLRDGRKPFHSINFITSHDGFTLNDLVSHERKHNEANGERNLDGQAENFSANYGVEGRSDDPAIESLRSRQIKNFLATLFLSLGTPMFLGGDELRRTQGGNNNAYCQDNATSWYDFRLRDRYPEIFRFTQELIHMRFHHPAFLRPEFYSGGDHDYNAIPDITWYDELAASPDWDRKDGLLALRIDGSKAEIRADRDDYDFYIMFNATTKDRDFTVAAAPTGRSWHRAIDTARPAPQDILPVDGYVPLEGYAVRVGARSMVVLAGYKEGTRNEKRLEPTS